MRSRLVWLLSSAGALVVCLGAWGGSVTPPAQAQDAPHSTAIAVDGLLSAPRTLTAADIAWLPRVALSGGCSDGQTHVYTGIDLFGLLSAAGPQVDNPLNSYVEVTGADGTSVVVAWGELDPSASAHHLLGPVLALEADGETIGGEGGFAKLVWDGCPSARDVPAVQRITLLAGPSAAAAVPATSASAPLDAPGGLAEAALAADDLPDYALRYVSAFTQAPRSPGLPQALYRGYWASGQDTTKVGNTLGLYVSTDAAHSAFTQTDPSNLTNAFPCAPRGFTTLGPRGVGDEDLAVSWSCDDFTDGPASFHAELFRRGRVQAWIAIATPPGVDPTVQLLALAQALDARLAAAQQ